MELALPADGEDGVGKMAADEKNIVEEANSSGSVSAREKESVIYRIVFRFRTERQGVLAIKPWDRQNLESRFGRHRPDVVDSLAG